jgi:uncharacterized protein YqgQ
MAVPSPVMGLSSSGAGESSRHLLLPPSPSVPTQPSGYEVGESSKEHESSDDVDYRQLLKDYRGVQAALSSTRLNAEMLRGELDIMHDAHQVSKNEVSQARAESAILKE